MAIEYIIMILMWISGLIAFILFTPKNRRRRLIFAFLVCKTFAWLTNLLQAWYGVISFPIREFPEATSVLITTGYFFYPLICGFYIIFEPKANLMVRFFYLAIWVSAAAIFEVVIEMYTNLIEYIHFAWYWTWIEFFCLFAVSNIIYKWFFRDKSLFQKDKEIVQ